MLPACVRVIQGDGVNEASIAEILKAMEANGLSADNVAFGMGGALLQKVNRDTMRFAMKANAVKVDGVWRDVYKDPVTDRGKRSKKGRLAVIEPTPGTYQTIPEAELGSRKNILETVYRNGKLIREFSFDEVRENASR